MAYVTTIGSNPEQIEYRLSGRHGCGGPGGGADRQFSYHTDGRERPLRWIGRGLDAVGIVEGSELTEEQFDAARALMDGRDPRTGESLVQAKRGIPDDAKVALGPLVRGVEAAAAEADVSIEEIFDGHAKSIERFARAKRQVLSRGEAARLRADHAGELADRAGIPVGEIWGEEVYEEAAGNLWETVVVRDHETGTWREERRPRRVIVGNAGYDITFTLPKSFSLLLAFADPQQAAEIEAVFMGQVETLFGWLEGQVAYGMRGEHGNGKTAATTPGEGLLGWTMVHRAARPTNGAEVGDPHWHVHLTVANLTRSVEDGRWSTIAAGGRDLMRHIPAVDHLLKATVRHELQQRFGVRFERNERSGAWEVVGLPDETLRLFSKRNADIKDMLEQLGYDAETASRAQNRIAEQRSRGRKGEATAAEDATLQEIWQSEERAAGRDPAAHMARAFGRDDRGEDAASESGPDPQDPDDAGGGAAVNPTVEEIAALLLDPDEGLTAHSRRFSFLDAVRRVADALPQGAATVEEIDQITRDVLSSTGAFVPLPTFGGDDSGTAGGVVGPNGATPASPALGASHMANNGVYTTADVVDAETVILRAARASRPGQLRTRVDDDLRDMAVSVFEAQHHRLGAEQRAALERLVGEGRQLDTVNGAPGTGKTTLMRALRVVYGAAGFVVGGAATAAVAAENLARESGIPSRTVASWLYAIRTGQDPLRGVDVLVLDEANLTEDRDRAELYLAATAAGTQVIEIGDGRQLRGVGVGSLFARVHEIVEGCELTENRRQADEDERAAIAAWRAGRYAESISIWQGRGQLVITEEADEVTAAMLRHWWDQRQGAPDAHTEMRGLVMLAGTNAQVRRLNEAAQAMRLAEGELGAHRRYDIAGGEQLTLHVGDHVLLRVNDRARHHLVSGTPVLNGYRAVITALHDDGSLDVAWQYEDDDRRLVTETARLDPSYVAAGGVELGYAMTVHKSEGLTVKDQWDGPDGARGGTVLFHAAGAENPSAHVATSRHRRAVFVFDSLEELETEQDRYLLGRPRTPEERDARAIDKLAKRARDTLEHGDDRPVVVDLGLEEFQSERGRWERTAQARDEYATERAEREEAAAEREQRKAERERRRAERAAAAKQRRTGAELLIREVWRHEPTLVELLLADAAFDAFARNLADAAEAGFDLREVLAEIDLDVLGADRITDKARFAAWSVTNAVERLRTGAAQRDYDAHAEQEAFDQAREQVTDLLDEVWQRPELVERMTDSPRAFDHLVRAFDVADEVGLDVRSVAAQINPRRLERDTVRDPAAMAAYLVRQITERQVAEREEAEQFAAAQRERREHQEQVAERLRQRWQHADPQAVERIVSGPSFGHLVDRIDAAEADGWDTDGLLDTLTPDVLAGAPSPSGAAAFAFGRAVTQAEAAEGEQARAEAEATPLSGDTSARLLAAARSWTARTSAAPDAETSTADSEVDAEVARLAEVTAAAAEYYAAQLDEHPEVLDYLRGRFGDQVPALRERFTIGYAPHGWRALTNHLSGLGFSEQELLDAGVAKQSRTGALIDRMRDRVLVAFRDTDGHVAGFAGRPPHDNFDKSRVPKYLNTPETALFKKSKIVFGLDEQREAIAAGGVPVLVEGTMDVLALAGADPQQRIVPVAASGTAVTEAHLEALRAAGADRLVTALDGDAAGQAAAERTVHRALRAFADVRVVSLPDGQDPNEWAQRHTGDAAVRPFLDADQQRSAADFLADRAVESYFAAHPPQHRDEVEGRLAAADQAARALREVPVTEAISTGARLAHDLGIDPGDMAARLAHHRLTSIPDAEVVGPVPLAPTTPEHAAEAVEDHAEPTPAELAAEAPDPNLDDALLDPAVAETPLPEPVTEVVTSDWRDREFGRLTDDELADCARAAETRLQRLREQVETADARVEQLGDDIAAGRGPHTVELDEHLADLRQRAELAREADALAETRRDSVDRAAAAAEARALAEAERDGLGRFALRRRAELDEQIAHLRQQEETAQAEAAQQAQRLAELQTETGDAAERRLLLTRAAAAERDDAYARPLAAQRDAEVLERSVREADRLRERVAEAESEHEALRAEQRVRAQLTEPDRAREDAERQAALQPATPHADIAAEHDLGHEHQVALPELDPPEPETEEPEL